MSAVPEKTDRFARLLIRNTSVNRRLSINSYYATRNRRVLENVKDLHGLDEAK
jgi:hypothetical protein